MVLSNKIIISSPYDWLILTYKHDRNRKNKKIKLKNSDHTHGREGREQR